MYRAAISHGMTKNAFFHSTPNDVMIYIEESDKRLKMDAEIASKRMQYSSWLTGLYVRRAVASVMSKRSRYPKTPFGEQDKESIECTENMSEEEKNTALKAFLDNLQEMQRDFERSKQQNTGEG